MRAIGIRLCARQAPRRGRHADERFRDGWTRAVRRNEGWKCLSFSPTPHIADRGRPAMSLRLAFHVEVIGQFVDLRRRVRRNRRVTLRMALSLHFPWTSFTGFG